MAVLSFLLGCGAFDPDPPVPACQVDDDCAFGQVCATGNCVVPPVHDGFKTLAIAPVAQQTPEWCWLASAQMIFTFYGIPAVNPFSYQCGVLALEAGPQSVCYYDCSQCVVSAGSSAEAAHVLVNYPVRAEQYLQTPVRHLTSWVLEQTPLPGSLVYELDHDRPVELGLTPTGPFLGTPSHAVVLVGYQAASGQTALVINDPFPYDEVLGPAQNPYYQAGGVALQPGQYEIDYGAVASALKLSAGIFVR